MFGYIVPCVAELKVREFERYRQYYCGLCRALKDRYGRTADLTYDAAFMHVLADGLTETVTEPEKVKCAVHPVRGVAARTTPGAAYAADANMLMAYAKAADDAADVGSLQAKLLAARLGGKKRRAQRNVPQMVRDMEECAGELRTLEDSRCSDPDAAAHPYGVLFGKVLSELDLLQSHILYDLGYNIGRWVYLIDAWDDMQRDAKGGQYNVYNARLDESGMSRDELRSNAAFSMHFTLAQATDALRRLELAKNRELLENIVQLGLYQQTRSVLSGAGRVDESIQSAGRF